MSYKQPFDLTSIPNINNKRSDYLEDMNLSFPELLKQEGINIRVTSDYREGAKTKQGKTSHHSHKDEWGHPAAVDFRAADGDYKKLLKQIYGNPRVCAWLRNHNNLTCATILHRFFLYLQHKTFLLWLRIC